MSARSVQQMKPIAAPAFRPGRHIEVMDDPVHDPYFVRAKPAGPAVCSGCGAVFHDGRWQWLLAPEHAHRTRCPACRRIDDGMPAGWVSMEGDYAHAHAAGLLELARNLEAREKAEHPLQRIMAVSEEPGKVVVTTTGLNLARAIGNALHRAHKGELDIHCAPDQYLLRVSWRR
ncbi:MAG TPA: BCAM0308 family protein [Telluria sp.]